MQDLPTLLNKKSQDIRTIVAMSGGVDSSVAAALMKDQGYDVIGVTLQLYDYGDAMRKKGACCAGQDIMDARAVASQLNIPHYVLDYESRFKENVIDDFVESYIKGETPLPCVRCNQTVKFQDLMKETLRLDGDVLVTGHYVQKIVRGGVHQLHRAHDDDKDQSYFLFATTREQLAKLYFPLGGQAKAETRKMAEKFALPVAVKPDSQDICFVPNGNYAEVIGKYRPTAFQTGGIVDVDGNVLGQHEGIIHYTIGQRKGIGIGGRNAENGAQNTDPLYVIKIDAKNNRVIVGPRNALGITEIVMKECNWLVDDDAIFKTEIMVKYRSNMKPISARAVKMDDGGVKIIFHDVQEGIAPGQALVCYDKTLVLGGGWIIHNDVGDDTIDEINPSHKKNMENQLETPCTLSAI